MEKRDKLTGQLFYPKRSNQVFASAKNRIRYHNNLACIARKERAYIDRILYRNFKILKELLGNEKEVIIHREFLLGKGFTFSAFTHYHELNNIQYHATYNYVIIPLEDFKLKILKI